MSLVTYSHPKVTKAVFLAEIQHHIEIDSFIQGAYGESVNGAFKGCAVGCSLESVARLTGDRGLSMSSHGLYEKYLGVPRILAYLEDYIFEGLPITEAKKWPLQFSQSIPAGADLSGVWNLFAPWMLREIVLPCVQAPEFEQQKSAVERVIKGYETNWTDDKPAAAAAAARWAADAAAADAARWAAARWAAAARHKTYQLMATKLCELMAAAPVITAQP